MVRHGRRYSKFDVNRDGNLSPEEIQDAKDTLNLELQEEKAETQRYMAWSAIVTMVIFTIFLFTSFVTDGRVKALADLLGLFYIAQAGIVGAYMGATAWMSNTRTSTYESYSRYGTTGEPEADPGPPLKVEP